MWGDIAGRLSKGKNVLGIAIGRLVGTGRNFLPVLIEKMGKECYNIHRN